MSALLQDYSKKNKFQFSIIIPLNNRLDYLESCLRTICQQQHQSATEILLLDDASEIFEQKDVEAILGKYWDYFPSEKYAIYYWRHPQKIGEYANLNLGVKLAKGDWIYIAHEHDLLLESTFVWFEELIQKQSNIEMISGAFYSVDEADKIVAKSEFLANQGLVDQDFLNIFLARNPLQNIATLYRKNVFEKVGYFKMGLGDSTEWEFLRRVSKIPAVQWYYLPQYLGACRYQEDSQSAALNHQIYLAKESVWQALNFSEHYFSVLEQRTSKRSRYWQCFQTVEKYFDTGKLDDALSLCLDVIEFSDLDDYLWLEVLNQFEFRHKQQIYELKTEANSFL